MYWPLVANIALKLSWMSAVAIVGILIYVYIDNEVKK